MALATALRGDTEGGHEAIAKSLDLTTAVGLHLLAQQIEVVADYVLSSDVALSGLEGSGADDVGEEDGDDAFRLVLCRHACCTTHTRITSPTPLSACSPRSSNVTPADVRASDRTVSDTSTSPVADSPLIRAATFTAPP